tara:strand:+ start:160 stop:519 length:360 start_codon:yes stop_codon:yes gene_type:complete
MSHTTVALKKQTDEIFAGLMEQCATFEKHFGPTVAQETTMTDEMDKKVAKIQRWWRGIDVCKLKMELLGLEVGKVVSEKQIRMIAKLMERDAVIDDEDEDVWPQLKIFMTDIFAEMDGS